MEAPVRHGISRSIFAAIVGAVVMAAAIIGIGLAADAGTTNNATQAPAATVPATTIPADDDSANDDMADDAMSTTTIAMSEDMMMDEEWAAYEEDYAEYEQCMSESGVYNNYDEEPDSEEEWMAMEEAWAEAEAECSLLLPEHIQIENAAWQAHSECVEEILGTDFWEAEDAWDEESYTEADKECRKVLPQDIQDELAAWDAYDTCTRDAIGDEMYYEQQESISYSSFETYESYLLGEGDSTITITKVDGEVTVTVDGDVLVQDEDYWAAEEAKWMEAEAACSDLAPEQFDH